MHCPKVAAMPSGIHRHIYVRPAVGRRQFWPPALAGWDPARPWRLAATRGRAALGRAARSSRSLGRRPGAVPPAPAGRSAHCPPPAPHGPATSPAARTAWIATASGSTSVPCAKSPARGSGSRLAAGTTIASAIAPPADCRRATGGSGSGSCSSARHSSHSSSRRVTGEDRVDHHLVAQQFPRGPRLPAPPPRRSLRGP